MKRFNFKIRIAIIVFACLAVTMSACGQGSKSGGQTRMSAEEIQRRINENKAAVDETMKACDEQLGNMSWPPQDAFKRFGFHVPQPEFDAPRGVASAGNRNRERAKTGNHRKRWKSPSGKTTTMMT
jgi:hypothetical protein